MSDGLKGGWQDVVRLVESLPFRLMSGDGRIIRETEGQGVSVIDKASFSPEAILANPNERGIINADE